MVLPLQGTAQQPRTSAGVVRRNMDRNFFLRKHLLTWYNPTLRFAWNYLGPPCIICKAQHSCNCAPKDLFKDTLVELREYPGKGIGVRTLRSIEVNVALGEFTGSILHPDSGFHVGAGLYRAQPNDEAGPLRTCTIDAELYGSWARYVSHSCNANTQAKVVPLGESYRWVIYSTRATSAFEELTMTYGEGAVKRWKGAVKRWKGPCRCGEVQCRKPPR